MFFWRQLRAPAQKPGVRLQETARDELVDLLALGMSSTPEIVEQMDPDLGRALLELGGAVCDLARTMVSQKAKKNGKLIVQERVPYFTRAQQGSVRLNQPAR